MNSLNLSFASTCFVAGKIVMSCSGSLEISLGGKKFSKYSLEKNSDELVTPLEQFFNKFS